MKKKLLLGAAVLSAAALALAACSSGGGAQTPTNSSSAPSTEAPPASDSSSESEAPAATESSEEPAATDEVKDLGHATILNNWFAEAEQGGYWAAQAEGLAKARGVDLEVKQGGPGIQTIPQVTAGEADFGVGNADEIMVAVSNGLPIVAVATGEAQTIQCLAFHESTGIKTFADINGHTVSRVPSPYWDFIKSKYKLDKVDEINIGSPAQLQADPNLVMQCFITAEPYVYEQMGMTDIKYLLVGRDGGYMSDQTMLFTTQKYIDEHPDIVKAVVDASNEGWTKMMEDPTKTKELVMKANPDGDPGQFDYAIKTFKENPDFLGSPYGAISPERFAALKDQLVEIGLLPADFDETKAYTTAYNPTN